VETRANLLRELVRSPTEVLRLTHALSGYGWDSEVELVQVCREDVLAVLGQYVSGDLSATAVEEWADALEVRDDIGFGTPGDESLRDVIHLLANPELEGALSLEMARHICRDLR
jgi:hypothetical protein